VKTCPVCATEYPDDVRFCPNDGQTLRSSSPGRDLVGQVIADRYHIVKKLGEGGMGQVYLAEHVKMGRKSAIKVMNPSMVHDPDAVARFNREAANASRITHPNVCAIYDFGETPEGLIYLAMEFVEGEPLTDVLAREGPLPVPRGVLVCTQVADALQAAHDLGIVHRDLKPDNIMLARGRDGGDVVKVVDFGIAKAVGGDDSQKVTKTGLVVGTPEFMSPEQLSGDMVDGRSDIYSLALVLFQMLTGKLPFDASTVQETMIQRLTDEPRKLAAVRPDLHFPPGLQETIDAALARRPVERYQSAAKFANDVAAVVGLQRGVRLTPLPSTQADEDERTQLLHPRRASPRGSVSSARRRLLIRVLVGGVAVLGVAGAAVLVFGGGRKTNGAPRPTAEKPATAPSVADTVRRMADTTTRGIKTDSAARPSIPRQVATRHDAGAAHGKPQRSTTGEQRSETPPAPRPERPAEQFARAPRVDSAAVERALGTIIPLLGSADSAAAGRRKAMAYYDSAAVPARLRAQAAFMVAQGWFLEGKVEEACHWTGLALDQAPTNETYLTFKLAHCPR
jgi:eukaryotic-like serine/threonine-protein kinase